MSDMPVDLAGCERHELEKWLQTHGEASFHAGQIFRWVHKRITTDPEQMTDLSRALRAKLADGTSAAVPALVRRDISSDGTEKFLLRLADGRNIESVFIPDTPAMTFCISTQVGCAMGCAFCLTGKMGLTRHLTAGEIVGQVHVLAQATGLLDKRFNLVLMGMGEPLHNYDHTMKSLRILADAQGMGLTPRRITLSTVGLVPALERLGHEPFVPNLAISLHATTEEQRDHLVPVNHKYSLAQLMAACRSFPVRHRGRITFEYVLLNEVNDTPADARRLVKLMRGIQAKVNLLPLNAAAGIPFERPSDERVNAFARVLADARVTVSVRKSRGRDIRAACGQLLVEGSRRSPAQALAKDL